MHGANALDSDYKLGMPGNSPNANRVTDAHGFADLPRIVKFQAALSREYWNDARYKHLVFDTSTPATLLSAMQRAWSVHTSKRIVTDIMGYVRYLFLVIRKEGLAMPEVEKRSGRR